ncbi:transmembrane protein 256 [Biomphalaria glabrata]|uniref:Transmembrane protein 256 homolog n=1 Tax=Biomphalaria glabrata TaxID=6526 RepID=A0A2C9LTE4_BIOGL|nr:transmembrane protein 256 homolog [Biomphalaria glabrata]KAI8740097.1 transmembrane protein 256 [Biomphalaria glabrata]
MADILNGIAGGLNSTFNGLIRILPRRKEEVQEAIVREIQMFVIPRSARLFIRIAGISGAIAVAMGAYGSHVFRQKEIDQRLKETFEIASKYHFIHTLALLAVPFARKPVLTGSLMTAGIVLFCGSCYYHAMTNNMAIRKVTPYGGFLLIFAWVSFAL